MTPRYGVLCAFLFFFVLILGYENYAVWSPPSGAAGAKREAGRKVEGKAEPTPGVPAPKEGLPRESIQVIAEKNIFNPERKEFSSLPLGVAARPVTRPQIVLHGVVISGEFQSATIQNPGRALMKGERETKTIKIGESVGEYKLAKILPDRIVMEGGEDSFEVLLHDPRSPKRRLDVRTPTTPATVTSAVPSAAPPGVPRPTPPAAVMPPASPVPGGAPPAVVPRPATPVPVPRAQGTLPEGIYPSPGQPTTTPAAPTVPDPGLWRGRRPISPAPSVPPG